MNMQQHSFSVTWRYVVPPLNWERVLISQRQDGPFRDNEIGGSRGHYYVSREVYSGSGSASHEGSWTHVPGSASGAFGSFDLAFSVAEGVWQERCRAARAAGGDDLDDAIKANGGRTTL